MQIGEKAPEAVAIAQAPEHAAAQVFKHRKLGKDVRDLKAARQPHAIDFEGLLAVDALTVQQHLAAAGLEATADQVEQRALAGTVGADDGDTLSGIDRQVGAANDFGLAEALAQITQAPAHERTAAPLAQPVDGWRCWTWFSPPLS